jgi:site-specific DNA-methyltransferase (adenine-specific)
MKFVTDLGKGILGQADSTTLWTDILANIPDSVLSKPNVRILNIACGHGTEAILITKRMLALGISKEAVNDSMYLLDKYNVFTSHAKSNYGFKNVITADFLTWETDMKFDVIVGNPPYQGNEGHGLKIWPKITSNALNMLNDNGYIGWVIPSGWLESNNALMKKVRTQLTTKFNLHVVDRTANNHFSVGQDILYFVASRQEYQGKTRYVSDNVNEIIDLRNGLTKGSVELLIESILDRVVNSDIPKLKFIDEHLPASEVSVTQDANYKYPIIYSTANRGFTKNPVTNDNKLKIAVNISSSYYSDKTPDNNMPITTTAVGALMCYILIKTQTEGEMIKSYLRSKIYRFVAQYYRRKNTGFVHAVRQRKLPELPLKMWTDEELYKHFNLTQEEIDYVEANVK